MKFKGILFTAALAVVAFSSCRKEALGETVDVTEDIEYEDSERVENTVYFLGSAASGYLGESISGRCDAVVLSAGEASIMVARSTEMKAFGSVIEEAYNAGKVIVELEPQNSAHCEFWESIGAPTYLDPDETTNDLILLAVCGHSCYQLQNPYLEDVYFTNTVDEDDEPASESSTEDRQDRVNFQSVPVAFGQTVEFMDTKLESFSAWLDDACNGGQTASVTPEFDGDLSKYISDASRCQHIMKTFNVGADNFQICKVVLSDPDRVSRHSTIDLELYIAPLYSYELNGSDLGGDYYFVSMSLVAHHQPMYGLYKEWHWGVRTWAHIFYGKDMAVNATLLDSGKGTLGSNIRFFETPRPVTTATSTTYTTGFSSALNVSGQGGITGGAPTGTLTVGGTFTWSNSESRQIPDQAINMSTEPTTRAVKYEYLCNNARMEDSTEDAVPAIARSDQNCEASWCWHVTGTKDDDSSTHFILRVDLNPEYEYMWRHATWGVEGDSKTVNLLASSERTNYFDVAIPNRKRNGIVEIKTTNSQYMYGLKIYDKSRNVVAQDDGAYEKNAVQRYQIPVGTYDIEYEIRNGDTGESLGNYRIADVEIKTAQTTSKSTIDGKKL